MRRIMDDMRKNLGVGGQKQLRRRRRSTMKTEMMTHNGTDEAMRWGWEEEEVDTTPKMTTKATARS